MRKFLSVLGLGLALICAGSQTGSAQVTDEKTRTTTTTEDRHSDAGKWGWLGLLGLAGLAGLRRPVEHRVERVETTHRSNPAPGR